MQIMLTVERSQRDPRKRVRNFQRVHPLLPVHPQPRTVVLSKWMSDSCP
jgi:hypothetical protein